VLLTSQKSHFFRLEVGATRLDISSQYNLTFFNKIVLAILVILKYCLACLVALARLSQGTFGWLAHPARLTWQG
jgi:hypothetical protein